MLIVHMIAFAAGFVLDLLLGDPHFLPHPVQAIGLLVSLLEKIFLRKPEAPVKEERGLSASEGPAKEESGLSGSDGTRRKGELLTGVITVCIVLSVTAVVSGAILFGAYYFRIWLGIIVESFMTYRILAVKSLYSESMKVFKALKNGTIEDGRKAVSMIVGRDTDALGEDGVIKAAVETVAENTSDGVLAPMIYTALFGPVGGFLYKAVNTMDSMIGYKNGKYLYFGRAAAKLDDVLNYLPSRISAGFMILACVIGGKNYNTKNAVRIHKRDRRNHASPNSAQTESVVAGAIGLRLAGDAYYFGKLVKKPFIGDELKKPEPEDIKRSQKLMLLSAVLCELCCLLLLTGAWGIFRLCAF